MLGLMPSADITLTSRSVAETRAIARAIAATIRGGELIVLAGEMGAGKTAFTQGFAVALGVDEPVTSPTFTLVRSYTTPRALQLHHLDVYRLERLAEFEDLGIAELLDARSVVVIEWGDAVLDSLPSDYLGVELSFGDEADDRDVHIEANGSSWTKRLAVIAEQLQC